MCYFARFLGILRSFKSLYPLNFVPSKSNFIVHFVSGQLGGYLRYLWVSLNRKRVTSLTRKQNLKKFANNQNKPEHVDNFSNERRIMDSNLDLRYERLLGEGSYGKVFLVKQQDGQQVSKLIHFCFHGSCHIARILSRCLSHQILHVYAL